MTAHVRTQDQERFAVVFEGFGVCAATAEGVSGQPGNTGGYTADFTVHFTPPISLITCHVLWLPVGLGIEKKERMLCLVWAEQRGCAIFRRTKRQA